MMHLTTKGIREGAGSVGQQWGGGTRRSEGLQNCGFLHGQRSAAVSSKKVILSKQMDDFFDTTNRVFLDRSKKI